MARVSQQTKADNSWWRILFRFVSGRDLDGIERTDATFFQKGTISVRPHITRPSRWSMLPGYVRVVVRFACVAVAFYSAKWHAQDRDNQVIVMWSIIGFVFVVFAGWWMVRTGRRTVASVRARRVLRQWIRPLHFALYGVLNVPRETDPLSYIDVPANFERDDEAIIRIGLPDTFTAEPKMRTLIASTVAEKLALGDVDPVWRVSGREPHLVMKRAPQPPSILTFADALPLFTAAEDKMPVLGLGPRQSVVAINLDEESPHIAISAGSGGGKSVMARTLISQALSRGHLACIADVKRVSHRWAKGLPGVAYARNGEEIHHMLIALAAEGERRYDLIDEHGEEYAVNFPRVYVLLEELNATMSRLQKYWDNVREKSDPKRSPAVDAIGDLLFMGRACRIHVIAIAQMLTANAIGGPAARENFAIRILSRYTMNAAKMLAPEVTPFPKSSKHRGRVQVVIGGEATATQVAFLTEDEARTFVIDSQDELDFDVPMIQLGSLQKMLSSMGLSTVLEDDDAPALPDAPAGDPVADVTPIPDHLIGLSEACAPGGVFTEHEISLDSARAARHRDPEFPTHERKDGTRMLYDPDVLRRYAENRVRPTRATARKER